MFMQMCRGRAGLARAVLVAVTVAVPFVALGTSPNSIADYYRDTLTPAAFSLWIIGLIVASVSPPIIATAFWFASQKSRHGWLLHIFLLPISYAITRGTITMMLTIVGEPDSDGPTGWATDPAVFLTVFCPVVYFAALAFANMRKRRAAANVR